MEVVLRGSRCLNHPQYGLANHQRERDCFGDDGRAVWVLFANEAPSDFLFTSVQKRGKVKAVVQGSSLREQGTN